MTQWEYLKVEGDHNLAQLGREGWELVAALPDPENQPVFYFKRPLESFRDRVTEEQKQRYYARLGLNSKETER